MNILRGGKLLLISLDGSQHMPHAEDRVLAGCGIRTVSGATVYVTGTSVAGAGDTDVATVAYDAASGVELWSARWDGGATEDTGCAGAVSDDGRIVYATGTSDAGAVQEGVTVAYSAATGTELWVARYAGPADPFLGTGARDVVAAPGESVYVAGRLRRDGGGDSIAVAYTGDVPILTAGASSISVAAGGSQPLSIDAGPCRAGSLYLLLGSITGTVPGIPLGGLVLPLNLDAYFLLTLTEPNAGALVGTFGTLDARGLGAAAFELPPGSNPALAGLHLDHAAPILDPVTFAVQLVTEVVGLDLVP